MNLRRRLVSGGWCLVLLALVGCARPAAPAVPSSSTTLEDRPIRVTGPYVHDNLAVFLIHSDQQEQGDFLTLDEGLTSGQVEITEKDQGQVQELVIDNKSDRPLYLQEGERIQGGKQDRTIASSLVIPAHSGKQALPAFCIEQSRWVEGKAGRQFAFSGSAALAPKGVRGAAKFEKEQNKVWSTVAAQKESGMNCFFVGASACVTSSANELLDAPQVQTVSQEYARALTEILNKHPDAVGVAIAVNGQFEEADIYPNHRLLRKLYPRLVQSYAVQAALLKDQANGAPSLSTDDVIAHLQKGPATSQRQERLDAHNVQDIQELDQKRFECSTRYDGQLVNWQMMKKTGVAAAPARGKKLGTDW